jgi:uncharacterized membrane protein YsdA (DUF1294 family)
MITLDWIVIGWVEVMTVYTFLLFGWDKRVAAQPGRSRVSEFHLACASALGGWLGGLIAMQFFRHKTAKTSFKAKFAVALLFLGWLVWTYWQRRLEFSGLVFGR